MGNILRALNEITQVLEKKKIELVNMENKI